MKAFAKYFDDNGVGYRTNTILQFGNSTKIIGAAFLINPGSAKPLTKADANTAKVLADVASVNDTDWYEFSVDSTMRWLANIFNGYYAGNPKELNGVILLYNLFNLRNANCYDAVVSASGSSSKYLFTYDIDIQRIKDVKKVYLGWGYVGLTQFNKQAKAIFSALSSEQKAYLHDTFERNSFTHPRGVQLWYKRSQKIKNLLNSFLR